MNWSRDHDRTIAEKCELLHKCPIPEDIYVDAEGIPMALPSYNTDIACALRAAETWVLRDPTRRWFHLSYLTPRIDMMRNPKYHAVLWEGSHPDHQTTAIGSHVSLAAAIAEALYEAVTR